MEDGRKRVKKIFNDALEKDPEERAAFIHEACCEDPSLERQVMDLLKAHEAAGDFLESPFGGPTSDSEEDGAQASMEGKRIGEFRILRKIASGGMGTVYEAEQIPLKRLVALKVLPAHLSFMDTAILKFRREAEAGGRQRHPGIVSVYAVGEHHGVHYIAQELVEGGGTLHDRLERSAAGRPSLRDISASPRSWWPGWRTPLSTPMNPV